MGLALGLPLPLHLHLHRVPVHTRRPTAAQRSNRRNPLRAPNERSPVYRPLNCTIRTALHHLIPRFETSFSSSHFHDGNFSYLFFSIFLYPNTSIALCLVPQIHSAQRHWTHECFVVIARASDRHCLSTAALQRHGVAAWFILALCVVLFPSLPERRGGNDLIVIDASGRLQRGHSRQKQGWQSAAPPY